MWRHWILSPDFAFTLINFMPCFWSSILYCLLFSYLHLYIFLSTKSTASLAKCPEEKTRNSSWCPFHWMSIEMSVFVQGREHWPRFPLSTQRRTESVCNGCLTENESVAPLISQRKCPSQQNRAATRLGPHRWVLTMNFKNYACSRWTTFSMPSQPASLIIHPARKRKKQKHRDEEH